MAVEWKKIAYKDDLDSHASQHGVDGSDSVFPANPGADKYLMWDDDPGELVWGSTFVDRGDPVTYDWTIGDLTANDAWHELVCSGIVPAGAKAILLLVLIRDDSAGQDIHFRKYGNTNSINRAYMRTQVANIYMSNTFVIPCSTSQSLEYMISTGMDAVYICIMGWWE